MTLVYSTMEAVTILLVVYLLGVTFVAGFFFSDEISFKNPDYWHIIPVAISWPLGVMIILLQKMTGIYVGDVWRDVKRWNEQRKCDHSDIEACGEYTLPSGKSGDKICKDCGKVWWDE